MEEIQKQFRPNLKETAIRNPKYKSKDSLNTIENIKTL